MLLGAPAPPLPKALGLPGRAAQACRSIVGLLEANLTAGMLKQGEGGASSAAGGAACAPAVTAASLASMSLSKRLSMLNLEVNKTAQAATAWNFPKDSYARGGTPDR